MILFPAKHIHCKLANCSKPGKEREREREREPDIERGRERGNKRGREKERSVKVIVSKLSLFLLQSGSLPLMVVMLFS